MNDLREHMRRLTREALDGYMAEREALLEYAFLLAAHNKAPVTVYAPALGPRGALDKWEIPAGVSE